MKVQQAKTKPAAEVRYGNIRAAIWRNGNESSNWYNVTFERTYRDGEELKSTSSFGRDDLLVVSKVAYEAHTLIHNLQRGEE